MRRNPRSGSAIVEFTLVGIPMIFVLISIVEMARGLWTYQTLAYAVKEGSRFAIVKGSDYKTDTGGYVTAQQVVDAIMFSAVGVDRNDLQTLDLISSAGPVHCPNAVCSPGGDAWPPATADGRGNSITIEARYNFRSAMAFFLPGGAARQSPGVISFWARTQDVIQF